MRSAFSSRWAFGPFLLAGALGIPAGVAQAQVAGGPVAVEDDWLAHIALDVPAEDYGDAYAEPEAPQEPKDESPRSGGFYVSAIAITGSDTLKTQDFGDVITPYLGHEWSEDDLRKLTQEIADSARADGYVLATARIPRQSLDQGILQVEVNEGRIDDVRIIGSDNPALAGTLAGLTGRKAHKKEVERALTLAGDIPDIIVQKSRFVREDGRNILEVTVRERGDTLVISADNYGTERFGPVRLRASYRANALLFGSDTATLSVRTNPVQPKEFVYGSADYEIGLGHNGTRLGLNASIGDTQPGPGSSGFSQIEGDSLYGEASLSHPIHRSANGGLWINAGAAYLSIEQESLGALLSADTQVTFTLGINGNYKVAGGRLRAGVTVTQGADVLGTTRRGDARKSRFDGDGVFRKASVFMGWSGPLWGNLGLALSGYGQIADRPLLASQEISIGGAFSARGFDFSEISGENGAFGLAELNYTFKRPTSWLNQLQPYAFVDGGYADNKGTGGGDGSLLSAGMGVRAKIGGLSLEVEGAAPINRARDTTGDKSPQVNLWLGMDI